MYSVMLSCRVNQQKPVNHQSTGSITVQLGERNQ
jgi:hypothetical protein